MKTLTTVSTRTSRAATAATAAVAIFMIWERFVFLTPSQAFTFQQQQHKRTMPRSVVPTLATTCITRNNNGDEERMIASQTRRLPSNGQLAMYHHHAEQNHCHNKRCQQQLYSSSGAADNVESSIPNGYSLTTTTNNGIIAHGYYRVGQYVFGATAAILMCIPDRTLTAKLASKWGGAAGYGLAAGLSHILAKQAAAAAASKNEPQRQRLASETSKRLNVGLLGFSVLGLAAMPGEAGFFYTAAPAMVLSAILLAVHVFGIVLSYTGWKYAVVDVPRITMNLQDDPTTAGIIIQSSTTPIASIIKQLGQELWRGTKSTVQGLRVKNAKIALTYRNCLLLVLVSCFSNFMDGIFHLRYQDVFKYSWFEVSLDWSGVSRLFLISTMVYSLKDAAERDRLTGATFIQMNVMIGAWAALVGLGQAIYPLGIQGYRGVTMFSFSLPFFIKAIKAIKQKKEMQKEPIR